MKQRTIMLAGVLLSILGMLTQCQDKSQLILTEEENKIWTANLIQEKHLSDQLDMLRTRLLSDTNVFFTNFADLKFQKSEKDKYKSDGFCRPLLVVDGKYVYITNYTPIENIEALTETLTTNNIKSLNVSDKKMQDSGGSTGICEEIVLTTKNENVLKEVIRLNAQGL